MTQISMSPPFTESWQGTRTGMRLGGRYFVLERLGAGGMGVVFRGVDPIARREVALKTIRPGEIDDHRRRLRLAREARMLARVSHPNVLRLVDVGFDELAGPFLVLDHVPGATLRELIAKERRLAPARAIALMRQLLAGLGALHARGIVHADVKSSNVIITPRTGGEHLTLIDFGLAREAGAPPATPATDQYAAGIVLTEMVTGVPPSLDGKGRALYPAPAALGAVMQKALARRPRDRFPGVAEMAVALRSLAQEPFNLR
jgi:serine/threonine protein kinase